MAQSCSDCEVPCWLDRSGVVLVNHVFAVAYEISYPNWRWLMQRSGSCICKLLVLEVAVMFRRSVVGAILILCSGYLCADKHPVPLDKGISDSKCLECHEDKTKGKVIHPAVQMGCFSCHFVRGSGDDTRIVLKNVRIQTLCTSCHGEKKVDRSNNPVHPPVISDCLKCHDPHQSENSSLLKKSEVGNKGTNFCLDCHEQGEHVPERGSRHAALDAGCNSCHLSHKSGKPGDPEAEFHLTKSAPALCLDCHDAKDATLVKAHQGQPFA